MAIAVGMSRDLEDGIKGVGLPTLNSSGRNPSSSLRVDTERKLLSVKVLLTGGAGYIGSTTAKALE